MNALVELSATLRERRGAFGVAVLLGAIQQALAIAAAVLGAHLVALAASSGTTSSGTASLGTAPGPTGGDIERSFALLAAVVVALGVMGWIKMWFEYALANRVLATLRKQLYDAFVRLAPAGLDGRHTGELASVAMADIARVDWFLARFLPSLGTAVLVPVIGLGVLAWLDPLSAVVLTPFVMAVALVPVRFRQVSTRQGDALQRAHTDIQSDILDAIGGLREMLAFGRGDAWLDRIDERSLALQRTQVAFGVRAGLENALTTVLVSGGSLLVLTLAARRISVGTLAPDRLLVVVVLATAVFGPILAATHAASRLGVARASAARVAAILRAPSNVEDAPDARPPDLASSSPLAPTIRLEGVHFRYEADGPDVLRGLDLDIAAGEVVALVGASGAGKSTCADLVMRFFDPRSGRITYAGHDLRALPQDWLRAQIGYVSQDAYLFDASVADNIRLACHDAPRAAVEDAARRAQADDFVRALPEGYDTHCGERGAQLSGGQRQRIAIARALLADPPLLIFDEATSHLDSALERAFHAALRPRLEGRTVLLVAHRPATIAWADRVVVLEDGRVVEDGAPDALLARGGAFARLLARDPQPAVMT